MKKKTTSCMLYALGAGISRKKCEQMADKVQKITQEMLSGYLQINENPIR